MSRKWQKCLALIVFWSSTAAAAGQKPRFSSRLFQDPAGYVAIYINREHLYSSAKTLGATIPETGDHAGLADFTQLADFPLSCTALWRKAVSFPGSRYPGNFSPAEAVELMKQIAHIVGPGGALLVGVDLHKAAEIVEPAYNDREGVTAAFNLNLRGGASTANWMATSILGSFDHRAFLDRSQ